MEPTVQNEAGTAVTEEASAELDSLLRGPSVRGLSAPVGAAVYLGQIAGVDAEGAVDVEYPGSGGALRARRALASAGVPEPPLRVGQQVVLTFENGNPALPIILGFIQPARGTEATPAGSVGDPKREMEAVEADVDGRRVRIVAQDEIVLQCGNASVTLRRNGRVLIRGTYIETYSEGTNRIKGGQVRIN